eukprot:6548773-Prymnesium_polylepis.1
MLAHVAHHLILTPFVRMMRSPDGCEGGSTKPASLHVSTTYAPSASPHWRGGGAAVSGHAKKGYLNYGQLVSGSSIRSALSSDAK